MTNRILAPNDDALSDLCRQLADAASSLEEPNAWPSEQLRVCAKSAVLEWFVPAEVGGQAWTEADIVRGYLRLSAACLTTTFVITQLTGALRRIAISDNAVIRDELLPDLLAGNTFATVGISHLTTSRRHLKRPVLRATESGNDLILDGYSPWVTGAPAANTVVIGASLDDGREVLVALPMDLPGIRVPPPAKLVGLTASQTGPVQCDNVRVDRRFILAGPVENVMSTGSGANTGGLQTSTLAVGLSDAAITFVESESDARRELVEPAEAMRATWTQLRDDLLLAGEGQAACSAEELRTRANSLALRSAQAALTAAKGAGYVIGHPAGRWCREALFFLVWSCPQPVLAANMCELAGITDA